MAPTRKSYVSLTSTQNFKLLYIKNGMKQADAARKYGVERTTISKLKTQEAKIRQANLENKQPDKKRVKVSGGEDVQKAMLTWFRQARSENIPINGPLLMRQMVISLDAGVKPDDFPKSITIPKALYMLKRSVFLVKPSTISNCFSKAGF